MRVYAPLLSFLTLVAPASAETLCQQISNQVGSTIWFGEGCNHDGACKVSSNVEDRNHLRRGQKYQIAVMLPDGYAKSAVAVKVRIMRSRSNSDQENEAGTARNVPVVELKRDAIPFACGPDRKRAGYPAADVGDDEKGAEVGYGGYDGYHRSGSSSPEERKVLDQFHIRYGDRCISTNEWKLRPYFLFQDPDRTPGFLARLFHVDPNMGKAYADSSTFISDTVQFRVRLTSYSKDPTQRACVSFPLTATGDKIQLDIVDLSWARQMQGRRQPSRSVVFNVSG